MSMTTDTKKRPINRLKTMYALRALVDDMYKSGLEAKKEGKPVAWCMLDGGFAGPFLNAIGMESVYPENYGTVCAAAGKAQPYLERSAADGFPDHLCGYARNCFGYTSAMAEMGQIPPDAPSGGMPKPVLLLASGMVCDARFKWFQALGSYLEAPVWTLESPRPGAREGLTEGAYERHVAFLVKGLREFGAFLEKLLGKKIDWAKFEEEVDTTIAMNKLWYNVNQLRKARPGPMHSRDFWSSMSGSTLSTMDPKAVTALYLKMYDEVKERVDKGISGIGAPEKYRLTFIGLPPWHSLGFFDKLAERGWNFVIEQTYHPPKPIDVGWVKDPVEKLVRYRFQSLAHQIEDTFSPKEAEEVKMEILKQGFSPRMALREAMEYQCDGAMLHTLLTCRGTTAPLFLSQNQLMDVWNIPSLVIEGDIVDHTLFDPQDALRKAEVFEETMDHYKKVRKEKGLPW
jgi:benzoyl-CoA reductase/2-hydroxyglutaryl-CoA dehydratase subunit BcrC/BadD/HgdB